MIKEFVKRFNENKSNLEERYRKKRPESYEDIVKWTIETISDEDDYSGTPDPERIHIIDDGDYQGTLVFVIAEKGYQPHKYWYVRVWYGSCSGCDTLQAIKEWGDEISEKEVKGYMTLSLHIIQQLKAMDDEAV